MFNRRQFHSDSFKKFYTKGKQDQSRKELELNSTFHVMLWILLEFILYLSIVIYLFYLFICIITKLVSGKLYSPTSSLTPEFSCLKSIHFLLESNTRFRNRKFDQLGGQFSSTKEVFGCRTLDCVQLAKCLGEFGDFQARSYKLITIFRRQYYKLIAILRRQYCIILTYSWKKKYSVLGGVANIRRIHFLRPSI